MHTLQNDKVRKEFANIWSLKPFPDLSVEEWQELEQLIVNYTDFKNSPEHKSGKVVLNDYHITFEIKERPVTVNQKYILLTCENGK